MARILVVGAGMSGLSAAGVLQRAGHDVVVVDKGHRPGGRMATRRDGGATWDTGAQFLTAKTDAFAREVGRLRAAGTVTTWFHGPPEDGGDGHPRHRGAPWMRAIPEALARDVPVRCEVRIRELRHTDGRWVALDADGRHLAADAVVLTPPAPQALELLDETSVGDEVVEALRSLRYDPCWAVLVRPSESPDLPDHGLVRLDDHPLHVIADNRRKGISERPAVTLHASADRTRELFDVAGDVVGGHLLADAADWVVGTVVRTHRWRYSAPIGPGPADAVATTVPAPLAVAGDGFAGGRVEGAWTSGRAAAALLLERL